MNVTAVSIQSPGVIRSVQVSHPVKKANEALIKVSVAGICGSDVGAFLGTNPLVTYPRIIGHEVAGVLIEEGDGLSPDVKKGDMVVIDPYIYCGHCYPCKLGRTNCCEDLKVIGVHVDGAMQEVVTHPAHLVHKVTGLRDEIAALAEPVTIGLHAVHRTGLKEGEVITIIGAGAIGVVTAIVSLDYGAIPILIDIVDSRLEYASKFGIKHLLNPMKVDAIKEIQRITNGVMSPVVVEASGANAAIRSTLDYVSYAGRIALTGWPKDETPLPTNIITKKELDVKGSRTSAGEFSEAIDMLLRLDFSNFISKLVDIQAASSAVEELAKYPERYLKVSAVL